MFVLSHVLQGRACRRTEDVVVTLANTILRILSHTQVSAKHLFLFYLIFFDRCSVKVAVWTNFFFAFVVQCASLYRADGLFTFSCSLRCSHAGVSILKL